MTPHLLLWTRFKKALAAMEFNFQSALVGKTTPVFKDDGDGYSGQAANCKQKIRPQREAWRPRLESRCGWPYRVHWGSEARFERRMARFGETSKALVYHLQASGNACSTVRAKWR